MIKVKTIRISNPTLENLNRKLQRKVNIPGYSIYSWLRQSKQWAAPHKYDKRPPTKQQTMGVKIEPIILQWYADKQESLKNANTKLLFRKIIDSDGADVLNPDMIEIHAACGNQTHITKIMAIAVTGAINLTFSGIGRASTKGPLMSLSTIKGIEKMRTMKIPCLILYYDMIGKIRVATSTSLHNKGRLIKINKKSLMLYTFNEFSRQIVPDEDTRCKIMKIILSK